MSATTIVARMALRRTLRTTSGADGLGTQRALSAILVPGATTRQRSSSIPPCFVSASSPFPMTPSLEYNRWFGGIPFPSMMIPALAVSRRAYHEVVIDHFAKPRNIGNLDKKKQSVGQAVVGKASCGDVIKMSIEVDDGGKIVDAKFKTFGCGSAIASSSLATEMIKGKSVGEASAVSNQDIAEHLSLPPVKLHCSVLAEESIKAALEDWKSKNS